jgi:hypothetical protein
LVIGGLLIGLGTRQRRLPTAACRLTAEQQG